LKFFNRTLNEKSGYFDTHLLELICSIQHFSADFDCKKLNTCTMNQKADQ
jgi:hypothetical protein